MKSNMFLLTAGLAATALCSCSQKKSAGQTSQYSLHYE